MLSEVHIHSRKLYLVEMDSEHWKRAKTNCYIHIQVFDTQAQDRMFYHYPHKLDYRPCNMFQENRSKIKNDRFERTK